MAKTNSTTSGKQTLVGDYIVDIRDALIAGAASGTGTYLLGAPGGGKSACAKAFGRQMYGIRDKDWCFIEFSPATQEQKIEGTIDFQKWQKESKWEYVRKGTPSDPEIKLVVADELSRANDSIHDLFMGTMDVWEMDKTGTQLVATGNFLPQGDRVEAFLDRVGQYVWLSETGFNVKKVARAHLLAQREDLDLPEPFPTLEEIVKARDAKPTNKAVKATEDFIGMLTKLVIQGLQDSSGNLVRTYPHPNRRRVSFWSKLIDKTTTLYSETANYDTVHPMAIKSLQNAWVLKSQEEARDWKTLISTIADPVQAAIDAIMGVAYQTISKTAKSVGERKDVALQMRQQILSALEDMTKVPGITEEDPRYVKANEDLFKALGDFIRGGE